LVEQLSQHIIDPFADIDALEAALDNYSDPQLWSIADETANRLTHNPRLEELKPRNQSGLLTDQEKIELQHLLDKLHDLVLIRSKALALLQSRGYDIRAYLHMKPLPAAVE
jgi:hypothetical protein